LPKTVGICGDAVDWVGGVDFHTDGALIGLGAHRLDALRDEGGEIDGSQREADLSARYPRHVEHVADESSFRLRVPLDRLQRAGGRCLIELARAQEIHPAQDRVQGSA
jgi:hypothetical protein